MRPVKRWSQALARWALSFLWLSAFHHKQVQRDAFMQLPKHKVLINLKSLGPSMIRMYSKIFEKMICKIRVLLLHLTNAF